MIRFLISVFPRGLALIFFLGLSSRGQSAPVPLEEYLAEVLRYNEQLQVQLLNYEISRQALIGAQGVFEPELVLRGQYDDTFRPNNAEEVANLGGLQYFKQRQMLYSAAVEALSPSGARTRFGLDVRKVNNNLQPFRLVDQEWNSFFGLSIVQPLLKGAGKNVNFAALRVAAFESDQAYQEYRRQTMVILVGAEVAYWNLYFAQEQWRFYQESLSTVETLAADIDARLEAGSASQLEALNAKVAVRDRQAKLAVALQALQESRNAALGFSGTERIKLEAAAPKVGAQTEFEATVCFEKAQAFNPEYISRQRQISIETLRLDVAKNQGKPSLDLLGSFGLAGLSESFDHSLGDIGDARYPTWSVGLEFRLPLGGGAKSKSDLRTAQLRRQQAIRQLSSLRMQMRAAVENALLKIRSGYANVLSFADSRRLSERLLATEMERLKNGTSAASKVLETEQALFEARNLELENRIAYQRALLELDVVMGIVLEKRGIDDSMEDLAARTAGMLEEQQISDAELTAFQESLTPFLRETP